MNYPFSQFISDLVYYIKPYKNRFIMAVFFRASSDLAQLYPAWALSTIAYILTQPKSENTFWYIIQLVIIWVVLLTYKSIGRQIAKYNGFQLAERAGFDLYMKCLKHMFTLDLDWQEKENSGNKFKRISRGRDGLNQIIRRIFGVLIQVVVNVVGIIILIAQQDMWIAVAVIFFMITFYFLGMSLLEKPSYFEETSSKGEEDLGGITFEAFNNIRTIKSFSIDEKMEHRIHEKSSYLFDQIRQRIFWYRFQAGILDLYYHLFEIGVIGFIILGIWNGDYQVGFLILFVALYVKVGETLSELLDVTQDMISAKIGVARAVNILHTIPDIEHPDKVAQQQEFPKNWQTIQIKNLRFNYKAQDVLTDVSLEIKRGERIGIVGISGAGKSTLFKLLMDLYETYEGDILFDRVSLKNIKRQSYINHISVVPQDTELFNMSLKENIEIAAVSDQKNTADLLQSVIESAHLDDVIAQLPEGIDTLVGEKGIKLSGGQRQRVGIARALYRQPDILLLDEATSHLDVHSEKQIQEALHAAFGRCTAIVIAHRLSTIKEMDRIIVMQEGTIYEQGTFQELIQKNGAFAQMWREQKL